MATGKRVICKALNPASRGRFFESLSGVAGTNKSFGNKGGRNPIADWPDVPELV